MSRSPAKVEEILNRAMLNGYDRARIRQQMFERYCSTGFFTQMTCRKCGGNNSAMCECAYAKFQPTDAEMADFFESMADKERYGRFR